MIYTLQLSYEEMQEAVREQLRSVLPHFADNSEIALTITDSEGRTIDLPEVTAKYEYSDGGNK